jgi:hypothetical protein
VPLRSGERRVERLDPYARALPDLQKRAARKPWENAILAHRLCNRIDYSIRVGRSYASDLERIREAREDAIRRNPKGPDASTRI